MEQTVTVPSFTLDLSAVLTWLIIGVIAGLLASLLVRGRRFGLFGSLITGLIGALVGGFLFTLLNIQVAPDLLQGITIRWIDIIVAFVGAVLVLLIVGMFYGFRNR